MSTTTQNEWTKKARDYILSKSQSGAYDLAGDIEDEVSDLVILLADARKEVIAQKIEKIEKIINQKYPPNIFTEYTGDPNVMTMSRGVAESTHIRRLDQSEIGHIAFLEHILATLREEESDLSIAIKEEGL